jgi:hypothetical protein
VSALSGSDRSKRENPVTINSALENWPLIARKENNPTIYEESLFLGDLRILVL